MADKAYTLGLFDNFNKAAEAIAALRESGMPGLNMRDVSLKSPIEHPECAAELGPRPVYVQLFTLFGALLGSIGGFLLIASAQANFLRQPRGGFPIVPIPPDMVITYELFILIGVFFTVTGCVIGWLRAPDRSNSLYSVSISVDKIGVLVKSDVSAADAVKRIFTAHQALQIIDGT